MATIIDALVVELGLDTKKFAQGQKDAEAALTKTKDTAVKSSKEIEKSADKAAEALHGIARAALAMFAIFTGFNGIRDFVSQITSADAALGRLAKNLGTTPDAISAITSAVERQGGSAEAAAASLQAYSDSIQEIKTSGTSGILTDLYRLQGLGGKTINFKAPDKGLRDIADNLQRIAQTDVPLADFMGRKVLGNPDLVNLAKGGRGAIDAADAESRKHGVPSPDDIAAATKLQTAWANIQQSLTSLGRTITTAVSPAVSDLLTQFDNWLDDARGSEWVKEIGQSIREFVVWLRELNWAKVRKDAGEAAKAFLAVGRALKGWMTSVNWSSLATKLQNIWTKFDVLAKKLTGQDGLTVAFEAFGVLIAAKVVTPLAMLLSILTRLGLLALPPWLLSILGVTGAVAAGAMAESTPGPGVSSDPVVRAGEAEHNKAVTDAINQKQGYTGGFFHDTWTWAKRKMGLGGSDAAPAPTGADDPLKQFITGHEAGGYDTVYGAGKYGATPKPLTQMTIAEVLAYQKEMKAKIGSDAFPVGRAQWTESTLRGLTKDMDPNTVFTPELQEKLFDKSIAGRMGQGPAGFRNEWSSLRGVSDQDINAAIAGHQAALAVAQATPTADSQDVAAARSYLEATAIGAAKERKDSIAKLNPAFAVKAAELVKQARENGMPEAGISSGYRTPQQTGSQYDAAGYSGHSYGVASDFGGIGAPGSPTSQKFDDLAKSLGLGGYGADNPREFNHKELFPNHLEQDAARLAALKATLGPNGEMSDPQKTWAAAGVPLPQAAPTQYPLVAPAEAAPRTLQGYGAAPAAPVAGPTKLPILSGDQPGSTRGTSPLAKAIKEYYGAGGGVMQPGAMKMAPAHFQSFVDMAKSAQASVNHLHNVNASTNNTYSHEANIGQVNIHTAATDASGIARDIGPHLQRQAFATQANYGPA